MTIVIDHSTIASAVSACLVVAGQTAAAHQPGKRSFTAQRPLAVHPDRHRQPGSHHHPLGVDHATAATGSPAGDGRIFEPASEAVSLCGERAGLRGQDPAQLRQQGFLGRHCIQHPRAKAVCGRTACTV
jgi:hypothetical protein